MAKKQISVRDEEKIQTNEEWQWHKPADGDITQCDIHDIHILVEDEFGVILIHESSYIIRYEDELIVNKPGALELILDNMDEKSHDFLFLYDELTLNRQKYIFEKIKNTIWHNDKYRDFRGIKDILFV